MNDTYIELLVKKPDSKTATLLHKIMIGVGAVLFLAGLFTYLVFMLLGLVLLIGSIIPMLFTDIEYEYLLLGKEFTVDRIRKKENRKPSVQGSGYRLSKGIKESARYRCTVPKGISPFDALP